MRDIAAGFFLASTCPFVFASIMMPLQKIWKYCQVYVSIRHYCFVKGEGGKKKSTVVRKWLHVVPNWQKFFGDHSFCTSVFVYGIGFSTYGTASVSAIFTTIHVFSFVLLKKEFKTCLSAEGYIYLLKKSVSIMKIFY